MNKKKKALIGAAVVFGSVGIGGVTASAATISQFAQSAVPVANEYGLYPSVMIAQAIIESGSGQSQLASEYNNYFGVKYTSGVGVDLPTTEYINGTAETVVQKFQVYDSMAESFDAHAALLATYYPGTLRANTGSYQDATAALQGHYATDPNYAAALNNVIATYDLTAYDGGGATTPAGATPTAASVGGTYTVQAGDSFWSIASANGLTADELAAANGMNTGSTITPGQVLQLGSGASGTTTSVSANSAATGTYTIQAGDSFWSIAQANGMTAEQLASLNGLSTDSLLLAGQVLQLSASGVSTTTTSGTATYTVQSGDTLSAIAAANGTTASQLAAANGLTNGNQLAVGQVLTL
ncbi:MAG: LysM peptidoglycan-binding domain-containing protein [Streptococcaceae bacterium]|jgi:LysM repeat protein|nr:LysM peptidoglycan-binding domain-containing protein [Streptococcaceae bacterium]